MAENAASARGDAPQETALPADELPHVASDALARTAATQVDTSSPNTVADTARDTAGDTAGDTAADSADGVASADTRDGSADTHGNQVTDGGSWLPLIFGAVVALLISLLISVTWLIGEIRS